MKVDAKVQAPPPQAKPVEAAQKTAKVQAPPPAPAAPAPAHLGRSVDVKA